MEFRELGRTSVKIPAVGMGTWAMGGGMSPDNGPGDQGAVEAIKLGLDLKMALIDTAEMYGAGHSEELIGEAIKGRGRDGVFIATKVSPQHFSYENVLRSARKSLQRLGVEQIDLYQLHWPNARVPISETMRAMEKLVKDGMVKYIGISNYSVRQTIEAQSSMAHEKIVSNQVEYSLLDRAPERDILPYCRKEGLTLIAYSPLGQGRIVRGHGGPYKILDEVAARMGKTRSQVALNWLLHGKREVVLIPKAERLSHVRENADVADWKMSEEDYSRISDAFVVEA